jgi:hypothetical protein
MISDDDDDNEDLTPSIFHMIINNDQMKNHPHLVMLIQQLLGQLFVDDEGEHMDHVSISGVMSDALRQELTKLEMLDDEVVGNQCPEALEMIMTAYSKHTNAG